MQQLCRLEWYNTPSADKFHADRPFTYIGDAFSIWHLWHKLNRTGCKHVEVFLLTGQQLDPTKGYPMALMEPEQSHQV